jgi:acyl transferase domain-containing protein
LTSQQSARGEQSQPEAEIAIIGMSGRFPGAPDVHQFWRNISSGVEAFTWFSDEELLANGEDPALIANPKYVRARPVLDDIRSFDAGFFGVSPREATLADPQQLMFTECVWEVLEAAGYATAEGRGEVGVFAGMNISTYLLTRPNAFALSVEIDGLMAGNDKDALATHVSYRLDLRGPAVTVQTFCSTSLVATHLACASLRRGECDIALAGGVSGSRTAPVICIWTATRPRRTGTCVPSTHRPRAACSATASRWSRSSGWTGRSPIGTPCWR